MVRLTLVESTQVHPYENLALESWLLGQVAENEVILYLWQNQHTVVIGKNQNAWKECNITTLEADGGLLARRLSGGGAVYHDLGNLNFTFIARKSNYDVHKQTAVILRALRSFGLAAEASGRNDILIEGRKVSGNAYYEHDGRCYHHGTLMLAVDAEKMMRYLQVDPEKLKSKGVASVRARVTNLSELSPRITVESLKAALCDAFSQEYGQTYQRLSREAIDRKALTALAARYSAWSWTHGRKFRFDRTLGERFPWGRVDLELQIDGGIVTDVQVYSDALVPDFIDALGPALLGARYDNQALAERVRTLTSGEAALRDDVARWLAHVEC